MTITLAEIEAQLKEPFSLSAIDFLPKGKVERDGKTLCMALPYADPRVYQDRLNAVAYGEWSTPAPVVVVAGNKLICYVTVILCGVAHTDVGEATNNEENTGTEAWAQGFKRACSQFGLGRYLYDLEKEWVPFNAQKKQIDLDKAQKSAIVRKMYQKAGIAVSDESGNPVQVKDAGKVNGHAVQPTSQQKRTVEGSVQKPAQEQHSESFNTLVARARTRAYKLGIRGDQWIAYVTHVTGKQAEQALDIADVGKINADLASKEQPAREKQPA